MISCTRLHKIIHSPWLYNHISIIVKLGSDREGSMTSRLETGATPGSFTRGKASSPRRKVCAEDSVVPIKIASTGCRTAETFEVFPKVCLYHRTVACAKGKECKDKSKQVQNACLVAKHPPSQF